MSNIAQRLADQARARPDAPAIICPNGRRITFAELDSWSDRIARGLTDFGIGRGVRCVLMVPPSPELFALCFGLFRAGAVPVMVDPGMGVGNLGRCLAEAEPQAFAGIPKAHVARMLLGWGRKTVRRLVTVGPRLFWGGTTLARLGRGDEPFSAVEVGPDEAAAILFTSGSTGAPKGAVYTHGIFTAQVEMLRAAYGIEPGEIDLPTFPLFALFDPALGMTAVLPEMDFTRPAHVDPGKIIGPIRKHGITNMFGSPALLRRVAGDAELPTLKRVISAGAPVSPDVLERFTRMLAPGAEVHTAYGATESLPVSTIGSEEILGETAAGTREGRGVCVGRPLMGLSVSILKITDEPIEEWSEELRVERGEVGEIAVSGPVVTQAYFNRPESTALAKIAGRNGDVIHRMGDLGYFDDKGRLWFCGRKSQRVVLEKETLYTIPCEGVFNAHPMVHRTALVGVAGKPVLCVEMEGRPRCNSHELAKQLLELGARCPHTAAISTILIHRGSFPVDIRHNAKIFREKLATWAARRVS